MLNQRNRSKLNNLYGTYFSNSLFTDYSNTPKTFETNIKYFYWHDWQAKIKMFVTAVKLQDMHQDGTVNWRRCIVLSLKMLPCRYYSWVQAVSSSPTNCRRVYSSDNITICSREGLGIFWRKKSLQPPHTERPLWLNLSFCTMETFKVERNT